MQWQQLHCITQQTECCVYFMDISGINARNKTPPPVCLMRFCSSR